MSDTITESLAALNWPDEGTEKPKPSIGNGEWTAATIGVFAGMIVDGRDEVAIFRLAERTEPDENRLFVVKYEVWCVPNTYVLAMMEELGVDQVHKALDRMLRAGIVK